MQAMKVARVSLRLVRIPQFNSEYLFFYPLGNLELQKRLLAVRQFADVYVAEAVRNRLADEGIDAIVTGTSAAIALSMGGAITNRLVRLEVAAEDFDRADELLLADERLAATATPWICSRCDEQNEPSFEVCWSCSKPRDNDDPHGRLSDSDAQQVLGQIETASPTSLPPESDVEDRNPYRAPRIVRDDSPATTPQRQTIPPADHDSDAATRAYYAAIVGALVLPPLVSIYSMYLIATVPLATYQHPSLRRKLFFAFAINAVLIPAWLALYTHFL